MRHFVAGCLCLLVGVVWHARCTAGEVEELLGRARKAQTGGTDTHKADVTVKIKGTFILENQRVPFGGDFVARPGERDSLSLATDFDTARIRFQLWNTRGAVRRQTDGDINDVTPYQYIQTARMLGSVRATTLAALLHVTPDNEPPFTEKIGDRHAVGFHVGAVGDVPAGRYYFDKETGVLLKVALKNKDPNPRAGPVEISFSGHALESVSGADAQTLKQVEVESTTDALTAYLRKQRGPAMAEEKIKALIAQLGHDDFETRERATKDAAALGPSALPLLEKATHSRDLEIARRAEYAVEVIKGRRAYPALAAAVRTLGRSSSDTAADVLLEFLPAANDEVAAEIQAALASLAQRGGKNATAVERALTDKDERIKKIATAALGKDDRVYLKKEGRRLYLGPGRFPAKAGIVVDGKLLAEIEFLEVQYYNRVDDDAFAKPKP
jgi:hypothetical protein